MIPRRLSPRICALLVLGIGLALATLSDARPGGGETYGGGGRSGGGSSGGSSGGGSSSGGDGDLAFLIFLLRLCWEYPLFGIPALIVVIGFFLLGGGGATGSNWDSAHSVMHSTGDPGTATTPAAPRVELEAIARVDPDFSSILFEDFVFRLYATAHRARGVAGALDELAPYFSEKARHALANRQPAGLVSGVVVGAMHTRRVDVPPPTSSAADAMVTVRIEFEANYSVGSGDGSRRFVIEDWVLERAVSARTRPPEPGRRFPCPNCGAPWRTADAAGTQKCASCGEVVDNGRFDWQVTGIHLRQERDNIPGLDADVPERGTSAPTIKDPAFSEQWGALMRDDPGVTGNAIEARLKHVYAVVNEAWTARDLTPARAVLSDGLADYLQYWLDAYEQQHFHNVLEDMRLTRHRLAKLRRDRHYDALTIRIWASGKDYVVRTTDGSHVRGSQSLERAYSEYWTLIRAAGRRGAPRADATCGGCGAPLVVSMAGACGHCGAHVTAGEFDWVLSKIEQDDSYQG